MNSDKLMKYFFDSAYKHEQLVVVTIELLTKCNMKCKHCYIPKRVNSGFTFQQIRKLLEELRAMGILTVVFTGGEIFVREDILDIIQMARNLHMRVILLSNGTLLNDKIVNRLAKLHITQFSTTLFSLDANIHDEITGVKGSLDILLKNLTALKKAGINVAVKTPLMKDNMNELAFIKDYCRYNSFIHQPGIRIFSRLDGDKSPTKLLMPRTKLKEIMLQEESYNKDLLDYEETCAALKYSCTIDSYGDVYPCSSFMYKVGNVFEKNIRDIWYSSEDYIQIRNRKKTDIEKCNMCSLRKYCKRCPAFAYPENRDMYSCDLFAKMLAKFKAENFSGIE